MTEVRISEARKCGSAEVEVGSFFLQSIAFCLIAYSLL